MYLKSVMKQMDHIDCAIEEHEVVFILEIVKHVKTPQPPPFCLGRQDILPFWAYGQNYPCRG